MTAAAGLILALVCLAIVALGFALSVTAWQPGRRSEAPLAFGFAVGTCCFLLTAMHWLAHLLT